MEEINNKLLLTDGGKAFKKNAPFVFVICLMNALLLTAIFVLTTLFSLSSLGYFLMIIMMFMNILSFKFMAYRMLENKEVHYKDYYFSFRNFRTTLSLGAISCTRGILYSLLGYAVGTVVCGIAYGTILSFTDYSSLSAVTSALSSFDYTTALENVSKLPNIELFSEINLLVSILSACIFYLCTGMKNMFLFYISFDYKTPVVLAFELSAKIYETNKKDHKILNFISLLPIYFVFLGCVGIDKLLVYFEVAEVFALGISTFIFFISYSLILFKYYFVLGTLYLYLYKSDLKNSFNKASDKQK